MSTSMYASRKRKKPQKSVKPAAAEGAKSNPSKRHRERLNGELERLSNQLPFPQDVTSKLDKLTILRLCVSYLRAKSFFNVTLKSTDLQLPESKGLKKHGPELPEGELLLQVLNGFILVVTAGGTMFYASNNIQEYLGFQQSDVIHQSVYELIHTEDRAEFQRQLHWALNPNLSPDTGQLVTATEDSTSPQTYYNPELLPPENSTFLERNFVCRFRCLLDNSSGFLALNFQGRLKFLRGQNERTKDGKPIPPQLALFALASPLQPPSILEIRTKNLIFRTKHKLDFTPTACDAKGRIVLGYTEAELCYRGSGYQFIHAADMLYCAENHMRMIKTGETGMTVFRLLTKQSGWVWVQANARLIYKNGQPECVIVSQRVLTDKEGEENLRKRNLELPFSFTTGEAVLYDTTPKALGDSIRGDTLTTGINNNQAGAVDPNSLLGSLLKQDESIYVCDSPQKKQPPLHLPVDTPALPEEECGGIFSSSWQEGILSLSQNALFKQEPLGSLAVEDRDGDLWTFMSNLGIIREDFELFQQDEMFLNVDLDGRDSLPDLTDEILSYVQASLSKRSDCVFSFSAKLGDQDPSYTTLEQQGNMQSPPVELQQPALHQHSYIAPQWQQPQLPVVHPQSVHQYQYQPLSHYPQQCLHAQPHPLNLLQSTQYQEHHLSQPPTQQQLFPLNGQGLSNQLWQQQHDHLHSQPMPPQQQQLCHRLKHMQVNGSGPSHSQQAITNGQQIPPLFQVDKPGLQTCSHPQYGHLHRGEPTLSLPYRNQLNTVSITHCAPAQELSYVPTGLQSNGVGGDLIDQDLGEVLGSLDSDPQGEQNGRGAPQWSVETMSMYHQQHLTDPQSTSMGSAQLNNPVVLGRVSSTEQPFMPQFQNGSHGSL